MEDPEEKSWELAEINPPLQESAYEQLELFGTLAPTGKEEREKWAAQMCALGREDDKNS